MVFRHETIAELNGIFVICLMLMKMFLFLISTVLLYMNFITVESSYIKMFVARKFAS
jgi:hypothetical protein